MTTKITTKTIAGLGVLTAMVVVLQLIANYIQFGPISITLALFPIAVGAMIFGPIAGLFLGIVDGFLIILAPSTISGFLAINAVGTIFTCLLKTGLAGFAAGWIFYGLNKVNTKLAIFLSSISVPIINTGLFCVAALTIFNSTLLAGANEAGKNAVIYLFTVWIGFNFFIEFGVNATLALAFFNAFTFINKKFKKEQ